MELVTKIPAARLRKVSRDPQASAQLVKLRYVNDTGEGISRVKQGKSFRYVLKGKPVRDTETLVRIRSLVIPPAWSAVWICPFENGHLQATGLDARGRKQYRYHPKWNQLRNETKFFHLYEFGSSLPKLRKQVEKDFSGKELDEKKVLALVISVMEKTYIRVGNKTYEKQNGSYGLTTLKDKNVSVSQGRIVFSFIGKKSISQHITLRNRKLANAVKQCRDIPGKELFQYYTKEGETRCVDSGMINNYIKEITGQEYTAKDFRTWAGTLHALKNFLALRENDETTDKKKIIVQVLDEVSRALGNSRTVCKKYYVHPGIFKLYEEDKLHLLCSKAGTRKKSKYQDPEECLLLYLLKKAHMR